MANVHSVSAHFTQKKNLRILARPLVSRGLFYYRAPGDLRWEYLSPVRDILLIHGERVAKYTWSNGKFAEDEGPQIEATRVVMGQISSWLNGDFQDNRAFVPKLEPGTPAKIELVPVKDYLKTYIERVILTLSKTEGVISSIEILEPQGSSTLIEFSHIALNAAISGTTFESIK